MSLTGVLSLGVATVGIPLPTEAVKFDRTLYKVSNSQLGMGTFINMIAFHPSQGEAEEAMGADALATTAYVMGPANGAKFINQTPDIEGLIINSRKQKISSSGWKRS